ncbi:MAG TPA: YdeI/OmpD-associated family protein [Salinimicrobium sp.]|nr:YdeI/OmpD-associated family protein [Salinimicrobium sp.]
MAITSAEEYIKKHEKWQEELSGLREILLSTELLETIKWGAPAYTIDGKNVIGIAAFKNHYALWFFNGALLRQNTALLVNAQEGKTSGMRQIRFTWEEKPDPEQLRKYVLEAIENQKEGKEIKPKRNTTKPEIPEELKNEMQKDPNLKNDFDHLTPGKQREYAAYISEAKRAETRKKRLEKIIPMIREGIGLHNKYRNC